MDNQLSNPKVEVPSGISLNDKDYMNSFLSCLKEMSKNFCVAMTEASNEYLYEKYKEIFLNVSSLQRKVYELMFKFGWYQLEKADVNKITQKINMLSADYNSLN